MQKFKLLKRRKRN